MRLRTQLLVINLMSVTILLGAVVLSYHEMLLDFNQARLLTLISVGAGCLSSAAFWFMTIPITNSVKRLTHFAELVRKGHNEDANITQHAGPLEVRQLTESVQAMKQHMHESLQRLQLMEKTRRELIANVSHDLRTPIASIQSFVEALEDGVIDDEETSSAYLKTIHREVLRLNSLIDDLFELSKLEAGQQPFHPILFHIDLIIIEVLESFSMRIHDKQLSVDVAVAGDIPMLCIMPDKITRVISNIVDNAVRHSPHGSKILIQVKRSSYSEGFVEISIRDEAEGVFGKNAIQVFERFYRIDRSRNRDSGGSGLGLAIARSIVELHGGTIGVRVPDDESNGSEFWFTLPINRT